MVIIIVVAFVALCIAVDAVVYYTRQKSLENQPSVSESTRAFSEDIINIPEGIYFDKAHTWAFMEKNGDVKIGIDDFLLHVTGTLNRLKMKMPGDIVQKGEPVLSLIRDGKQLVINAPVSGTIKSQNKQILEDYSLINNSPYQDGWIYLIEPSNWERDAHFLMMAKKYKHFLNEEFTRLKDFLAFISFNSNKENALVTLQDGGEIKDHVLSEFGPEVWEEFQLKFLNALK